MSGGGRGRGGSGLSLTHEQLQSIGVIRGDNTTQTLTPPPLFPKLEAKPLPLNCDAAAEYMVIVKDQFIQYLHESSAYVKAETKNDDIERYSDKYKLFTAGKQKKTLDCIWKNLPTELRPNANRVRVAKKRKIEAVDIAKKLQTLEKKESQDNASEQMEVEEESIKKDDDDDNEELEEEQEQEYELDDGTDYANNYFDNGEDYDEEDDNLDDGPVY